MHVTKFGLRKSKLRRDTNKLPVWRRCRQWRLANMKSWHKLSMGQPTVSADITISLKKKHIKSYEQKQCFANYSAP